MATDFEPLREAELLSEPGSFGRHDPEYVAAVKLAYQLGLRDADTRTQIMVVGVAPSEMVSLMQMPRDIDTETKDSDLSTLPLVTIIHDDATTNLRRINEAFGIPRGYNSFALNDHPGDNDPEEEVALVQALGRTNYLLLQAELVELGSDSLAGATATAIQDGYEAIEYVGYFNRSYERVPDPSWTTRQNIDIRST